MSAYPATAPWLTESERKLVVLVNEADRALKAKEAFSGSQIRSAFTDWRTYCWSVMFITTYIPVYSVVLSLPSVIAGLGYSGTIATLLACPPYGVGFIAVLSVGFSIDRFGLRYWHYVGSILVAVTALIVLMIVEKLAVRYAMFFFVMFMSVPILIALLVSYAYILFRFVPIAIMWAWLSSNVAGSNKRAAASGIIFSIGNIGGAISGQIYRAEWAPRYIQGHAINIGCYALALTAGTILWWSYRSDNRKRDEAAGRTVERVDMLGQDLGELGDRYVMFSRFVSLILSTYTDLRRHPSFRYYL